jgi:hypothetical protein
LAVPINTMRGEAFVPPPIYSALTPSIAKWLRCARA